MRDDTKNGFVGDYLRAGSLLLVRENWDFYILVPRASILLVCHGSTTLTKRIEALGTRMGFLGTPNLALACDCCEPQTYFRSRKKRERSDDRKYVCRSQANLVPESSLFFKMAADILENEKTLGARLNARSQRSRSFCTATHSRPQSRLALLTVGD